VRGIAEREGNFKTVETWIIRTAWTHGQQWISVCSPHEYKKALRFKIHPFILHGL